MKICFLTTSFPRFKGDFAGKSVFHLARELSKSGTRITVIAPHEKGLKKTEIIDNVRIERFRYMPAAFLEKVAYGNGMLANLKKNPLSAIGLPFFFFAFFLKTRKLVNQFDLIHAHWLFSGLIACLVKKRCKKPFVLTLRHYKIKHYPRLIYKYVIQNADFIISPHPNISKYIKSFSINNFAEIPNFYNPRHPEKEEIDNFKRSLNLGDKPIISFIARLESYKDPITFVKSIPILLKRRKDFTFLLVGNGSLFNELKQMVDKYNLNRYIRITGTRSDIETVLACSSLFVALSPEENIWSNTLVEAMSIGIPCIVTDAGDTKKTLTHLYNSFIIDKKDETSLANGIETLISNPVLMKKLSRSGKELIRELGFNSIKNVNRTISIYEQTLAPDQLSF